MLDFIPYGHQDISEKDIQSVVDVLRSDLLTQGPTVPRFEQAVADYCGAGHAVAVNSATSALHIACLALGVCPGDWLWTSPITFVATANCGLYCGARVDFVDINPQTFNMSATALAEKLERAEAEGRLPKVVIPVHMAGQPCDLAEIHKLSERYGFHIIEDASHAVGGKYSGEPIGNCLYSDITVFSFHPVKIITSGEGGMALTNDDRLATLMQQYRSHGITSDKDEMEPRDSIEIWNYQQVRLGFNYRMTDIQAALGLSQMSRLDEFVTRRHLLAKRYNELFVALPLSTQWQHPDAYSSYHLFVIRLHLGNISRSHRQVYEALRGKGLLVNIHYIPVHLQPYFQRMGFVRGSFPEAERYYREVISLPIYPALTEREQDRVARTVTEVLGR